jgi:hypothetical protein
LNYIKRNNKKHQNTSLNILNSYINEGQKSNTLQHNTLSCFSITIKSVPDKFNSYLNVGSNSVSNFSYPSTSSNNMIPLSIYRSTKNEANVTGSNFLFDYSFFLFIIIWLYS